MSHFSIQQKLPQHCKSTLLQFKKKELLKEKENFYYLELKSVYLSEFLTFSVNRILNHMIITDNKANKKSIKYRSGVTLRLGPWLSSF